MSEYIIAKLWLIEQQLDYIISMLKDSDTVHAVELAEAVALINRIVKEIKENDNAKKNT